MLLSLLIWSAKFLFVPFLYLSGDDLSYLVSSLFFILFLGRIVLIVLIWIVFSSYAFLIPHLISLSVFLECLLCYGDSDLHMVGDDGWSFVIQKSFDLFILLIFIRMIQFVWQILYFLKACFDFVHIIATVTTYDLIPYQNLIRSIVTILNLDKEGLSCFLLVVCFFNGFNSKLWLGMLLENYFLIEVFFPLWL